MSSSNITAGKIASVVSILVGLITIYQFFFAKSDTSDITRSYPEPQETEGHIIPTASFIQIMPRFRDRRNIIVEPDSDYFLPKIDFPKKGEFFSAVIQPPVYKSTISYGNVANAISSPLNICFMRNLIDPETKKEDRFVVFNCAEGEGCSLSTLRNSGWVQLCTKKDFESLTKWDGKNRTDKNVKFTLKFKLLSNPGLAGEKTSWQPSLIPIVYAAETSQNNSAKHSWKVPSLETLQGMTDRERFGYTEFKITTGPVKGLPSLSNADSFTFMIWVNEAPVFIDGWPEEYLRKTLDPSKGVLFPFGVESLDFCGAYDGYEKITVLFEFRRKNQVVKQTKISTLYVALRDSIKSIAKDGMVFSWTGKYIHPKNENKFVALIFSTQNVGDAQKWQTKIAAAGLKFKNQDVVGVIRPPVEDSLIYGVVIGLREATGPIRFTFDEQTAKTLSKRFLKAFKEGTGQQIKVTNIMAAAKPKRKHPAPAPMPKETGLSKKKLTLKESAEAKPKDMLHIELNLPPDNKTTEPIYRLSGTVNQEVKKAFVVANDISRILPIVGGRFEVKIPMIKGNNYVEVHVFSAKEVVFKKVFNIFYHSLSNIPYVNLESPQDGNLGREAGDKVVVRGTVDDPSVHEAILFFNGIKLSPIPVIKCNFKRNVFVSNKHINTFKIMVKNKDGIIGYSDLRTVIYSEGIDRETQRPN